MLLGLQSDLAASQNPDKTSNCSKCFMLACMRPIPFQTAIDELRDIIVLTKSRQSKKRNRFFKTSEGIKNAPFHNPVPEKQTVPIFWSPRGRRQQSNATQ